MNILWRIAWLFPSLILAFLEALLMGTIQGSRIAWYETRAKEIVRATRKRGEQIYDLAIWELLRQITFDKQRNRDGHVVCSGCKQPVLEPHCHHKQSVAYKPELAFTPSNLTGLCASCHQLEHPGTEIWGVDRVRRPNPAARLRRAKRRVPEMGKGRRRLV